MIEETSFSAGKLLCLYMYRFSVYDNKIYHGMFWNEENDMWALTELKQGRILGVRCASHTFERKRSRRTYGPTNGRMDGWTDGRTHPLK